MVNKNVVDDELKHKDNKHFLSNGSYMKPEMNRIQSKDHNVKTYKINKVSLSCFNDKNKYLKTNTQVIAFS